MFQIFQTGRVHERAMDENGKKFIWLKKFRLKSVAMEMKTKMYQNVLQYKSYYLMNQN